MPNWKKLIVSGSDALLNSLNVSNDLTVSGDIAVGSSPPSSAALGVDGNIKGTGYLLLNDSNNQYIYATPTGRTVEIYASSSITSGDPAFRIRQDNAAKVDFGWDDDGTSEAFVWNYSNGGFKIGTNSTERFKISADGNVGIGTSSPGSILHVARDSANVTLKLQRSGTNSGATDFVVGNGGKLNVNGDSFISLNADSYVKFHANGSERMRIESDGKVGIGISSPTQPLHVAGIISGSDTYINDWNSVSASLSTHAQALVNNINGSGTADYVARFSDANTLTTGLIQDDGSSVGINAGPSSKTLYVNGTGQFTGEVFVSHLDIMGTNASRLRDDVILRFGTNRRFGIQYNSTADKLQFVSSSNTIVAIDGNGNITGSASIHASGSGSEIITDQLFRAAQGTIRFRKGTNTWDAMMMSTNGKLELANGGANDRGEIYLHADHGSTPRAGVVTFENESQGTSYLFTDTNKRLKFHTSDPGEDDSVGEKVFYNNFPDTATFAGDVNVEGTLTAQEFHTEFVSASIIYESGSTKFGDTSDDTHDFTGSVYIQGNYLNVIHPSPTIQLQDTSDDDDQKIRFLNNGGSIEYVIQTQDFTSGGGGDGLSIGSVSSDPVRFATANTTALTIDTSQNVGIGTSSPGGALHVYNGGSERLLIDGDVKVAGATDLKITGTSRRLSFDAGTGTVRTSTANSLFLQTNSTTALTINSAQSIQFDSYGSGNKTGTLAYSLGVDSSGNIIEFTGGSGGGTVSSITNGADNRIATFTGADSLNGEANLTFDGDIFAVNTDELYVSASRVGIGTTSPAVTLHVDGFARLNGGLQLNQNGAAQVYQIQNNALRFGTNNTERMRIDATGDVGIGETSIDARLHITAQASSGISNIKVESPGASKWAFGIPASQTYLAFDETNDDLSTPTLVMTKTTKRVGIGTTSPSSTLNVKSAGSNIDEISLTHSGNTVKIASLGQESGHGSLILRHNNGTAKIRLSATGSNASYFNAGYVGIGTTAPARNLHVHENDSTLAYLQITNTTTGTGGGDGVSFGITSDEVAIWNNRENTDSSISTNNTERIRIKNDGNVGIGTSSPLAKLHVFNAGYPQLNLESNAGSWQVGVSTGNDFAFRKGSSGSNYPLWLDSSGNVGIGTTSPAYKLDVSGSIRAINSAGTGGVYSQNFYITDNSGTVKNRLDNDDVRFYISYGGGTDRALNILNSNGYIGIGTTSPSAKLDVHGRVDFANDLRLRGTDSAADQGVVRFFVDSNNKLSIDTANDGNDLFVIDSSGNVGIGSNTPARKLDVNGEIQNNGIFRRAGNVIIKSTGSETMFGPGGSGIITFHNSATMTTGDETMRIDANGNLLLNNTSAGARLDIREDSNYAIRAEDASGHYFRVNTGGDVDMRGDLTVQGIITAQEFHTEFVSASIIHQSGSSQFGDTSDDNHDFTGSVNVSGSVHLSDSSTLKIGDASGGDLQLYHNGSHSLISNQTGNLYIRNQTNDGKVYFQADDGNGNDTNYFYLDGTRSDGTNFATRFPDQSIILLGSGTGWNDGSQIYHNGTNSFWNEYVGDINFTVHTNDGDILFKSDDGSGGVAEYFRLDGGLGYSVASKHIQMIDGRAVYYGSGNDLGIYHSSNNSFIENITGNLTIQNNTDDGDIIFKSDDGSGGVTTYFFLDGSSTTTQFYKTVKHYDAAQLWFGDGNDFRFYHNGTNSNIDNYTGNLDTIQRQDDGDIRFYNDDGSGGTTEYFRLDGGVEKNIFSKPVGVLSPTTFTANTSADDLIVGDGTGTRGITIYSGDSNSGNIHFADDLDEEGAGDNPAGNRDGVIQYSHANARFDFKTGGNQQALRLTNSLATFQTNVTLYGSLTVGDSNADTAQISLKHLLGYCENTDVDTGTETIKELALSTYQAVFFDYVVKNGTNLRAGTVTAVHDGTNVEFTDTSTKDLGDTSAVTLSVDISGSNMRLRATTTSDNWIVKANIRGIKV